MKTISRRQWLTRALGAAFALNGCGGGGGTDVASGPGSGGTGISGGGGVGSGGTGMMAQSAMGPIEGFGSIVVNGVLFDTSGATLVLNDAATLRLGMTVRVSGPLAPDLLTGTATLVVSSADLRGNVANLNASMGSFDLLSVHVTVDAATVYGGNLASLAELRGGDPVQVYGLPGTGAQLRATRIERVAALPAPVLTGPVDALDRNARSFRIGAQAIRYGNAAFDSGFAATDLDNGLIVRVRAAAPASVLEARSVEYVPLRVAGDGTRLSVGGLVTAYAGPGSMRIDGMPADASSAKLSGGSPQDLAVGVRVEATGTMSGGVLVISRLRLRRSGSADASGPFSARGTIGNFVSAAAFEVKDQAVDASRAVFVNGTAAQLAAGRRVLALGTRVQDDVLLADRVEFQD